MLRQVKEAVPGWAHAAAEEVKITQLDSFANEIHLLDCPSASPPQLIYRKPIFDATEPQFLRQLVEEGIAPKVLHWADEFRIEEYIDSRIPSILELSNPVVLEGFIEAIRELNESEGLKRTMLDNRAPSILVLIKNEWLPKA